MTGNIKNFYALRPLEKADLACVARWFQDVGDLAAFDRSSRVPYDIHSCEKNWELSGTAAPTGEKCWFAITHDAKEVVGIIGLESMSPVNRDAIIPLYIDKPTRRKGVGVRATALVLDFAFRQLGLRRITSYYRADNIGSRDLTKQVGFEIEGLMRQSWFANGQFYDMVVVGILHDEWTKRRKALSAELGSDTLIAFGGTAPSAWTWPPQDSVAG